MYAEQTFFRCSSNKDRLSNLSAGSLVLVPPKTLSEDPALLLADEVVGVALLAFTPAKKVAARKCASAQDASDT